jgi:hypothetical protein
MSKTPERIEVYNYVSSGDEVLTWTPMIPGIHSQSPYLHDPHGHVRTFGRTMHHSDWFRNPEILKDIPDDLRSPDQQDSISQTKPSVKKQTAAPSLLGSLNLAS